MINLTNNVVAELESGLLSSATTLTITAPQTPANPPGNGVGRLTLIDKTADPDVVEIVGYTSVVDNGNGTFDVSGLTRGMEGTTAVNFPSGATVIQALTAGQLNQMLMPVLVNSAHNADAGDWILADSSAGSFTITMPAAPGDGAAVRLTDYASSWEANPVTLGRNGAQFLDPTGTAVNEDFSLNAQNADAVAVYFSGVWRVRW